MKNNQLRLRMNDERMDKLRLYAKIKGKTMTQVVEELIDSLPQIKDLIEEKSVNKLINR